jgi:hypothetical protein
VTSLIHCIVLVKPFPFRAHQGNYNTQSPTIALTHHDGICSSHNKLLRTTGYAQACRWHNPARPVGHSLMLYMLSGVLCKALNDVKGAMIVILGISFFIPLFWSLYGEFTRLSRLYEHCKALHYTRLYEIIRDYTRLHEIIRDYTRLYEIIRNAL